MSGSPHVLRFLPHCLRRFGLPVAVAVAVGVLAGAAPAALGADVSPSLRTQIATPAAADATIPVIVTLTDQVGAENYAGRRAALIAAMKRTAAETQPAVIDQVDGSATRYWLINAVAVEATRDEIATLAADPAVANIDFDRPVRIADAARVTDAGRPIVAVPTFPDPGVGNWGLGASRVPQTWRRFGVTGRDVVVGSIDTGVDAANPALAGKVVAFRDFINGRPDPYDDNGHGTHTIGTMVGNTAGQAPIGVAPDAKVIVAKAAGARGVGPGSALLAAAQWMTDPDGNPATNDQPVVVNNSWTAPDANDPWFRQMIRHWLDLGIVPVFATGNNGPGPGTVGSPAGYPEVLAVGAADDEGAMTTFTARGPFTWTNLDGAGPAAGTKIIKPDVLAPGTNITSAVGTGYMSSTGTSMAAPHVAGTVALIAQANPSIRGAAAIDLIKRTSTDLGDRGPDDVYGRGQLNVEAAVAAAVGAPATIASMGRARASARFAKRPRARIAGRSVTLVVKVSGAPSYRWRVNGKKWSRPTSKANLRLTLRKGRQVVEAKAFDPRRTLVTTTARTVISVGVAPSTRTSFARTAREPTP